jgi:hypothetical protein
VDLHRLRRNLSSPQDIALIVAKRNRNLTCVLIDSNVQHDGGAPIVGEKVTTLPEYAIGKPILLEKLTLSQTHKHQSVQRLADQSSSFPLPRVQVTNDFPFAEVILTDCAGPGKSA